MIVSKPTILGYSIDNIKGKIKDLKELGFENPTKMIVSLPPILGYSIDNIKGKLKYYRHLVYFLAPSLDANIIMERYPIGIGLAPKRISLAMRILYDKKISFDYPKIIRCLTIPKKFVNDEDLKKHHKLNRLYNEYFGN